MVFMKQLEEIFTDLKVGDVPLITHDNIFYIRDISEITIRDENRRLSNFTYIITNTKNLM